VRKIYIIGIGAGNPDYLTMQAIKALNLVDVFFFMDKGEVKEDLLSLRKTVCERYITQHAYRIVEANDPVRDPSIVDYTARVERWHNGRVLIYERLIQNELAEDQCGAFLVWGDPSLYDSTLRIMDQVTERAKVPFDFEVIPGITSVQALAARHKIPLNGIGESVLITTGRRLAAGMPEGIEKVVVMLDGQCAFKSIPAEDLEIFWGAYLGLENEVLLSGPLSEISEKIEAVCQEQRAQKGWIMDTYLLSAKKAKA